MPWPTPRTGAEELAAGVGPGSDGWFGASLVYGKPDGLAIDLEGGRPKGVRPLRVAAEAGGAARVPHEVPGTALTLGLNRTGAAGFTPQGQWHAAPPSPRIRRSPLPRPQPR
jgi:hypothetical protein